MCVDACTGSVEWCVRYSMVCMADSVYGNAVVCMQACTATAVVCMQVYDKAMVCMASMYGYSVHGVRSS